MLVVVLLGVLIVAGTLVSGVWRIRRLQGTLRTRAEMLNVASREEESGERHATSRPRLGVGDHVTIRYHRGAFGERGGSVHRERDHDLVRHAPVRGPRLRVPVCRVADGARLGVDSAPRRA